MPKRQIVRMADEDGGTWVDYFSEYETIVDENPVLTIVELADMCDQNAESRNNHAVVGMHRILAALLHREIGYHDTNAVMREIAEYGGLDGMNGLSGALSAFKELGLEQSFAAWKLDEEAI